MARIDWDLVCLITATAAVILRMLDLHPALCQRWAVRHARPAGRWIGRRGGPGRQRGV